MPESSLTEEAAIPPTGDVRTSRVPAEHAIDVNVTGVPGRMAGRSPAWGVTIDANAHAGGDPIFGLRPDVHPSVELLVERDIPVLIHYGQPIASCPGGRGNSSASGARMSISVSSTHDYASKLLSRKVD